VREREREKTKDSFAREINAHLPLQLLCILKS
jgi:hypothetical protein